MSIAAAALVLMAAQAVPARHQAAPPQTDQTVSVQRGSRLSVDNFAGEVVIHTWDKDSVHVVARHNPRTRVNIRPTTGGLSITATGTMGPQGSVDYEITAPVWMPVKIDGTYNFVTVDGAGNEVSAQSVRGDIAIKGGTGFVTAKTIQGEVSVEGARGKVNVSSVNERIKIANSGGDITAETTNGDISLSGIDAKSVDVSTVNGDIVYEGLLANDGHYAFTTHNGDISLGVPETANATFTVRTYNGDFDTNLPVKGANSAEVRRGRRVSLTLGNGSAEVNLESFGGTIRVRRGTAAHQRDRN